MAEGCSGTSTALSDDRAGSAFPVTTAPSGLVAWHPTTFQVCLRHLSHRQGNRDLFLHPKAAFQQDRGCRSAEPQDFLAITWFSHFYF